MFRVGKRGVENETFNYRNSRHRIFPTGRLGVRKAFRGAAMSQSPENVPSVTRYRSTRNGVMVSDNEGSFVTYLDHVSLLAKYAAAPVGQGVTLTLQNVSDRFQFLEGLVNDYTYRKIAETAYAIYAASPTPPASEGQRPAFYGFVDDAQCRVEMCFTPNSPTTDGRFATAFYTHPAPQAAQVTHWPDGTARGRRDIATPPKGDVTLPFELARRVSDALGRFVSDEGWTQADMDTSDEFAAIAAMGGNQS